MIKKVMILSLLMISTANATQIDKLENKARNGDLESQYRIGIVYEFGKETPIDIETARYWYKKADKKGNIKAAARLGLIEYNYGNLEKAKEFFKKGATAEEKLPYSVFYYGKIIREQGNEDEGLKLIEYGAIKGVPQALYEWGIYLGSEAEKKSDYKAYIYLRLAEIKKYKKASIQTKKYKKNLSKKQVRSADLKIKEIYKKIK